MLQFKVSAGVVMVLTGAVLVGQTQPAARPQTARQALIEMVTGGEQGLLKHLTVEAQQALGKQKSTYFLSTQLGMVSALKGQAGSDFQAFDTGPVLFSATDKKEHTKVEILLESDDLNGAEEILQVSYHAFRDGDEIKDDVGLLAPQFQVELKQQDNIWRLNQISVDVKFPIGDPEFLAKLFGHESRSATGNGIHADAATSPAPVDVEVHAMDPPVVLMMLGMPRARSPRSIRRPDSPQACPN